MMYDVVNGVLDGVFWIVLVGGIIGYWAYDRYLNHKEIMAGKWDDEE